MYPSAIDTAGWLQQRNLAAGRFRSVEDLPREVVIYLLVTLAVHPERLPDPVVAFLAERFLGHCVGEAETS